MVFIYSVMWQVVRTCGHLVRRGKGFLEFLACRRHSILKLKSLTPSARVGVEPITVGNPALAAMELGLARARCQSQCQ